MPRETYAHDFDAAPVYVKRGRPDKWNFASFKVGEARVYPWTQAAMARSAMYKFAERKRLHFASRTLSDGRVEIKRLV